MNIVLVIRKKKGLDGAEGDKKKLRMEVGERKGRRGRERVGGREERREGRRIM